MMKTKQIWNTNTHDHIEKQIENKTTFKYSKVKLNKFNGQISTEYTNHPSINPDLIYLDGPNPYTISDKIDGFKINNNEHPIYIQEKLSQLNSNQFGFSAFGLRDSVKISYPELIDGYKNKILNAIYKTK